jgi:hypothetical protein
MYARLRLIISLFVVIVQLLGPLYSVRVLRTPPPLRIDSILNSSRQPSFLKFPHQRGSASDGAQGTPSGGWKHASAEGSISPVGVGVGVGKGKGKGKGMLMKQ